MVAKKIPCSFPLIFEKMTVFELQDVPRKNIKLGRDIAEEYDLILLS